MKTEYHATASSAWDTLVVPTTSLQAGSTKQNELTTKSDPQPDFLATAFTALLPQTRHAKAQAAARQLNFFSEPVFPD